MDDEQLIEDRVAELDDLQGVVAPSDFSRFVDEIAPAFAIHGSFKGLLEEYEVREAKIRYYAGAFEPYPEDLQYFKDYIRILRKQEDEITNTELAINQYGLDNSRDFLLALYIYDEVIDLPFPWDTTSMKPDLDLDQMFRYARKAQELFGEGTRFGHRAFAAGLMYDVLALLVERVVAEDKKRVLNFIEETFEHGVLTAKFIREISKGISDLRLGEFAIAAGLVHDIGKPVMAMMNEDYFNFLAVLKRGGVPRAVRQFAEEKRFGVTHSFYGAVLCSYFSNFRPLADAVLFHHDPYFLKKGESDRFYNLACIVSLASNIANEPRAVSNPNDPSINENWLRLELEGYSIDREMLVQAVRNAAGR